MKLMSGLTLFLVGALIVAAQADVALAGMRQGPKIPPEVMAKLKQYDSPYYTIYSDLDPAKMPLIIARMTSVAQIYNERTKFLGGVVKSKFQLYIIGDPELYKAAGGEAYGVSFADRLMGLVSVPDEFWHVVQHEAWHQFLHNAASDRLPGWLDEGMAEYFGESLWTGDGLVSGFLPKARYDRFMPRVKDGKIKPFKDIILFKAKDWAGIDDYDQGLTMIHFCLHAENGKYQKALVAFMKSVAGGATFEQAFSANFGNPDALQKAYLAWWATVSQESVVGRPRTQATVATLASFLGRAWSQGQKFDTADDFLKAAGDGSLKRNPKQALPDELLKEALDRAAKLQDWSFEQQANKAAPPKLVLKQAAGATFTATITLKQNLVDKVVVEVKEPAPAPSAPKAGT